MHDATLSEYAAADYSMQGLLGSCYNMPRPSFEMQTSFKSAC